MTTPAGRKPGRAGGLKSISARPASSRKSARKKSGRPISGRDREAPTRPALRWFGGEAEAGQNGVRGRQRRRRGGKHRLMHILRLKSEIGGGNSPRTPLKRQTPRPGMTGAGRGTRGNSTYYFMASSAAVTACAVDIIRSARNRFQPRTALTSALWPRAYPANAGAAP